MQRVHHNTAKAILVLTATSGSPGFFGAGSPLDPPTVVTPNWVNGVQEELIYIIQQGALVPNLNINTQVFDALRVVNDARYVNLTGDTMSGILSMGSNRITNILDPTNAQDAATKQYVDTIVGFITLDSLSDVIITTPVINHVLTYNGANWVNSNSPYDVGAMFNGTITASLIVLHHVFTRTVTFAAGLTMSKGVSDVAATAQTDFNILKNGVSIGTMRFAVAATVATFIMALQQVFAAGDILKVVAPVTPDTTLATITFTLAGTR